jgi:PAS domain S-box-containing protein
MNLQRRALRFLGLLFVGDIFLMAILASLIGLSDHLTIESRQSTMIVNNCTQALTALIDTTQALGYHTFQRSPASQELYTKSVEGLKQAAALLDATMVSSPKDKAVIRGLRRDFDQAAETLRDLKKTFVEGLKTDLIAEYLHNTRDSRTDNLMKIMPHIRQNFVGLINKHERLANRDTAQVKSVQSALYIVMGAGAMANILACFLAVKAFTSNIVNRLFIMCENMDRMANQAELLPLIGGGDELDSLDQFFHRLQESLTAASRRDRTMLAGMPAGTITFDSKYRIEFINPAFEKLTGHSRDLVGTPVSNILPLLDARKTEIDQTLRGKVTETEIDTKDGTRLTVALSLAKYASLDGQTYVCSIIDLSERNKMEQVKKDFVTGLSSELTTPLDLVKDSLSRTSADEFGQVAGEGKETIDQAIGECDRLLTLIADLVELNQSESSTRHWTKCNIRSLVTKSINAVKAYASDAGITVTTTTCDTILKADEGRLIQVLVNLLSNAIKYSPAQSTVTVAAREDQDGLRISVQDQGQGISEEVQRRIFEKFEQARPEDSRIGTGLGLSICKLIIEEHHGEIELESAPGRGSTFTVVLPGSLLADKPERTTSL